MKHLLVIVLLAGMMSCHSSAVFQSSRPPHASLAAADTVVALKLTDDRALPDSSFFLGTVVFRFRPGTIRHGVDSLFRYTKAEAREHGGNVLKLRQANFGFDALVMKWDLYSLPPADLIRYCSALDSAGRSYRASLQGHAIVHLLDRDQYGRRDILFGDSLLTTMKGVGFDNVRKPGRANYRFDRPGRLNIGGVGQIDIELGKEYYVVLYISMARHAVYYHYLLTDRDGYENSCLTWAKIF